MLAAKNEAQSLFRERERYGNGRGKEGSEEGRKGGREEGRKGGRNNGGETNRGGERIMLKPNMMVGDNQRYRMESPSIAKVTWVTRVSSMLTDHRNKVKHR